MVEVILVDGLSAAGEEDELLDSGLTRLLHPVLDERLVDDSKHLLGDRLGGRQKARAESADGQDRLANGSCHETVSTSRGSGLLRGIAGCLATGKPGRQVTQSGGPCGRIDRKSTRLNSSH